MGFRLGPSPYHGFFTLHRNNKIKSGRVVEQADNKWMSSRSTVKASGLLKNR